ncbi:uncharacterized protein LOC127901205 [Citrus sinensis]|uniref:uncharacterized protein LOC127901205 n=1 Tax=Citrus sinensis TaxID=2711 RepID=UPI0022798924|nr:uncharacterized protein LOC127901205 [Citrus sinensis]
MRFEVVGVYFDVEFFFLNLCLVFLGEQDGEKNCWEKGLNVVREPGESSEEAPLSDSAPHISLSDDDGSPLASPKLSRTKTNKKSKIKGKHPAKSAHRKTRPKTSRPKSPIPVSIPEPPLISPSVSVAPKLYALGGRPATPRDLERVKTKYNIPHSIHLRVPRKGERPKHPHYDRVALHIDLFDLGFYLPLQPFFRKMFTEMKIAPEQLSLPGWRLLTGLELKKPTGLSVAYFATWGVHGNLARPDPLLKKGYRYGWFVAEGEWGKSIPAGNEVVQVRNFFNEDNITWTKGTCPIHEVGRKVNGVIEKFQILQSEGDVLCTSRLARAGLIKESFQSSSGGNSRMDHFGEDFDAFFSRMSGSSSGTLGTSAKGDRPPVVPGSKGKLPVSSLGGSRGTPGTHKRKLGSLFSAPRDLMEGELDPVANKRISHLTDCFLHSFESISTDMAI